MTGVPAYPMRTAFLLSFVAHLVLTVVELVLGPPRVAIHFGPAGEPDSWASAWVNALLMAGIAVLVFVSFYFAPHLLRVTPPTLLSLPHKDYWLREENRGRMESILMAHLYQFGTLTFVFLFVVGLLALQANLSEPVRFRTDLFWWPFGLYLAYTVYWSVKVIVVFRVPKR